MLRGILSFQVIKRCNLHTVRIVGVPKNVPLDGIVTISSRFGRVRRAGIGFEDVEKQRRVAIVKFYFESSAICMVDELSETVQFGERLNIDFQKDPMQFGDLLEEFYEATRSLVPGSEKEKSIESEESFETD